MAGEALRQERRGASVSFERVAKSYGALKVLDDISVSVGPGELLALLGPSGSGKSTLLSILAGLETPDAGDVCVDGRSLERVPPNRRNIGMVFQRATLFPHMSVEANVAFPLEVRGVPSAERRARAARALDVVRMPGLQKRMPHQLSGGQQQRVSLARALVYDPPVLLMDEPFSALDRKLRIEMQEEVKRIQDALGVTIVFVTHDQEEALHIADRIAVLHGGRLQQVAEPRTVYGRPANAFVADFLGRLNLFEVTVEGDLAILPWGRSLPVRNNPPGLARLGLRPEHVKLVQPNAPGAVNGTVVRVLFSGNEVLCSVALDGVAQPVLAVTSVSGAPVSGGRVGATWDDDNVMVFPA